MKLRAYLPLLSIFAAVSCKSLMGAKDSKISNEGMGQICAKSEKDLIHLRSLLYTTSVPTQWHGFESKHFIIQTSDGGHYAVGYSKEQLETVLLKPSCQAIADKPVYKLEIATTPPSNGFYMSFETEEMNLSVTDWFKYFGGTFPDGWGNYALLANTTMIDTMVYFIDKEASLASVADTPFHERFHLIQSSWDDFTFTFDNRNIYQGCYKTNADFKKRLDSQASLWQNFMKNRRNLSRAELRDLASNIIESRTSNNPDTQACFGALEKDERKEGTANFLGLAQMYTGAPISLSAKNSYSETRVSEAISFAPYLHGEGLLGLIDCLEQDDKGWQQQLAGAGPNTPMEVLKGVIEKPLSTNETYCYQPQEVPTDQILALPTVGQSDYYVQVFQGFNESMLTCPERVWPDYNWNEIQVVMIDHSQSKAFSWTGQKPLQTNPTETDLAKIPIEVSATTSSYSFTNWNGRQTIAMNKRAVDILEVKSPYKGDGISYALPLAIHEGFHKYGQNTNWQDTNLAGARTQVYPMTSFNDIYYRYMAGASLQWYLFSGDQNRLKAFTYWYDKFIDESDEQTVRNAHKVERVEGSARYVEVLGAAIGKFGCSMDETQLIQKSASYINLSIPTLDSAGLSYSTGAMASLVLRKQGEEDWQTKVMQGLSPMAVLRSTLSNTGDYVESDDEKAVRGSFESMMKQANQRMTPFAQAYLTELEKEERVRVLFNDSKVSGSYSYNNDIIWQLPDQSSTIFLYTDYNARFSFADNSFIDLKASVAESVASQDNPCGFGGIVVPMPKALFSGGANGIMPQKPVRGNLADLTMTGNIAYQTKRDTNGNDWICIN